MLGWAPLELVKKNSTKSKLIFPAPSLAELFRPYYVTTQKY